MVADSVAEGYEARRVSLILYVRTITTEELTYSSIGGKFSRHFPTARWIYSAAPPL